MRGARDRLDECEKRVHVTREFQLSNYRCAIVGVGEQDVDTNVRDDSGTERTADDIEATADAPVGGQGPEELAMHITDG